MGHQRKTWPEAEDDILFAWWETAEGEYSSAHDRMVGRYLERSAISVKCRRLFLGLHEDAEDGESMTPIAPWPTDATFDDVMPLEGRLIAHGAPRSARFEIAPGGSATGCSTADLQCATEGGLSGLLEKGRE